MQKESEVETHRTVSSSQAGLEVYGGRRVGKGEKAFIKEERKWESHREKETLETKVNTGENLPSLPC